VPFTGTIRPKFMEIRSREVRGVQGVHSKGGIANRSTEQEDNRSLGSNSIRKDLETKSSYKLKRKKKKFTHLTK